MRFLFCRKTPFSCHFRTASDLFYPHTFVSSIGKIFFNHWKSKKMSKMKIKKMIIATLLGGLTLFIWGGFSHTVLFVGTGFKPLPNEDKVMEMLKTNISEQGLYFFPSKDFSNSTKEQDALFEYKFKNGPVGQLVYRPLGGNPFEVSTLFSTIFLQPLDNQHFMKCKLSVFS
jgi:hypothetical protein